MTTTLENKTVVIVGGSSGIGFAVALASLQSLASLVVIASSNTERVSKAVERLQAHNLPGAVRGEVLDAKDDAAIKEFVVRLGEVDHIVWTSGDKSKVGQLHFPRVDLQQARAAFDVRFWGPLAVAQNAKFRRGGSLIITMGPALIKPQPTMAIFAAVTGSIQGVVRSLAVDLAPQGIRVNAVSPGGVDTELWDDFPAETKEVFLKGFEDQLLIKRIAEPQEIAEAYIFLMKCGYITGQRIDVDGGIALA
ncbi:short-chain dehydrogenase/reductase SDR [Pholiota molesta]|nr:short-chain dehydrogenase/reductase SDR [Pholiota molesta]